MQNSTGLRLRLSFCAAAVPNNRRRVRREDGAKYHVMGLLLGRRFGLAQSERAASRPDLPTHLAQNFFMQNLLNNRKSTGEHFALLVMRCKRK